MSTAIILVDHGSREPSANEVVTEMARLVQAKVGDRAVVRWAHMELCEPNLEVAIDAAVAAGASLVIVQPLFLVPGRHAARDIPALASAARERHPGVTFQMGEVIGADPLLAELVVQRCGLR
jgi:sirohydrochlorin cobaltochelatase